MANANDNLLNSALSMMANLRARRGDLRGALEAMRAAIEQSERIGDRPQTVGAVAWALLIMTEVGEVETAAVLAGVIVDGPLAELNNFPGSQRAHGDRHLAPIEVALGTEAYRAAAARGAAMSFPEVVAFLGIELDRLLSELP